MSYGKSIDFLLNQMRNYAGSLASGTVTFYSAGTTSKKAVYLDRAMTAQAANPYTLSADGTAELFAQGLYRIVFKGYGGSPVYDYDNVSIGGDPSELTPVTGSATSYDLAGSSYVLLMKSDDSATPVTIIDSDGNTIMGGTSMTLTVQYETVKLILDGSNWVVI